MYLLKRPMWWLMVFAGAGCGFGPSMQWRSCVSIAAHPAALYPADAQQAINNIVRAIGKHSAHEEESDLPRTLDIIVVQGFFGVRFGFLTRRTSKAGRRIGFCGILGDKKVRSNHLYWFGRGNYCDMLSQLGQIVTQFFALKLLDSKVLDRGEILHHVMEHVSRRPPTGFAEVDSCDSMGGIYIYIYI